jgi:4-amino-4-deoxy-L-arabinose transferase-like glycosyltransferase
MPSADTNIALPVPSDVASRASWLPLYQPIVLLAAWFGAVAWVTGVWHDVPVIDDWTYAWAVEHLLRTGTFNVLDWSSAYTLSQALWGAAWSALLGFSFATLRLSTLALATIGCGTLYLILRELGASTRAALIGALSLAVNPLFVLLSSSFMTEVPFMTFSMLALLCYVRAATRGELRLVWWAGVWSLAAFLCRQVGIVTPVAGLPLLLMPAARSSMTRFRVALALAVTWGTIVTTGVAMRQLLGMTSAMDRWSWNLYAGGASYVVLGSGFVVLISFYILPALLADASAHRLWHRPRLVLGAVATIAALLFVALGELPSPLQPDHTWSPFELGSSRALVNGNPIAESSIWLDVPVRVAGLLAAALLLLVAWRRRGAWRAIFSRRAEERDGLWFRAPLIAYAGAYLVLVNLLWMYHDRYYLVLVPPLIALVLGSPNAARGSFRLATATIVLFAAIALVGTRDALGFNQAVRDASQSLLDAGVPPSEIDAGYAWNGWMLYAHPANLAPGLTPLRDVPWISSDRRTEYVISKAPNREGYAVEREISWQGLPWPGSNRLFVLKQKQAAN